MTSLSVRTDVADVLRSVIYGLLVGSAACARSATTTRSSFRAGDIWEVTNGSSCMAQVFLGQTAIPVATLPPGASDQFHIPSNHTYIRVRSVNQDTRGSCSTGERRKIRLKNVTPT